MASSIPVDIVLNVSDENRMRLILLTKKIGLKYTKKIFCKYFPKAKDPIQLRNKLLPYEKNNKELKLFPDQRRILYGTPAKGSNIENYDSGLMLKILNLKVDQKDTDIKTLKALQDFRNWLAHYPSIPLEDSIYTQKFKVIKQILMNMGASSDEIDYFLGIKISDDERPCIIEELLRDIRRSTTEPIADLVMEEVLDIVSQNIETTWKKLAIKLGLCQDKCVQVDARSETDEMKMNYCFELLSRNISWNELKDQLTSLKKHDIIEKINNVSCITVASKEEASDYLKAHYKNILLKMKARDTLEHSATTQHILVDRQDAYVNLTLSQPLEYEENTTSEHIFNLHNQFMKCNSIGTVDVITKNDRFVAIRGVAGIGKSTFTDNYVLKWTDQIVLPEVDLLFYFKCRDIGDINENLRMEDLLLEHFPKTFEKISLADLKQLGTRILIIFDGLDALDEGKQSKLYNTIKNVLHNNFRVCVTGRPNAIQKLLSNTEMSIVPKLIDVLGFTMENIEIFIGKHYSYHENKKLKVGRMKQKLNENLEMRSMATIPTYLWIMCCLNGDNNGRESSSTNTCLLASLVITRELQLYRKDLSDISQNKHVLGIIIKLAELSFRSLRDGKIILQEADFGVSKIYLQECGFLLRYINSKGETSQLRHLIFSEFFCGLYLFLMGEDGYQLLCETPVSSMLWNALPYFLSLRQSESKQNNNEKPSIVDIFLLNICKQLQPSILDQRHKRKRSLSKLLGPVRRTLSGLVRRNDSEILLDKLFKGTINIENKGFIRMDESWILLLTSIYEQNVSPPAFLIELIKSAKEIEIDIKYHHQLRSIDHLFQHIPNGLIDQLNIQLNDDAELHIMGDLMGRCEKISMSSKFDIKVFTEVTMDDTHTKFCSLHRLNVFSTPDENDINQLLQLVPHLQVFQLDCSEVSVESGSILSQSIMAKKIKMLLDELVITNCIEEDVLCEIIPCIPCIRYFHIGNSSVSIDVIKQLVKVIHKATMSPNNIHADFTLSFTSCQFTNDHIEALSPCLPYLYGLILYDNPRISNAGYKTIVDTVLQGKSNGRMKLKEIGLSYCKDDQIKILQPIIPHLTILSIVKHHRKTINSNTSIRQSINNTTSNIKLYIGEDNHVDKCVEKYLHKF